MRSHTYPFIVCTNDHRMLEIQLNTPFSLISLESYLEKDPPANEGLLQQQFFPDIPYPPGGLTESFRHLDNPEYTRRYIVLTHEQPVFLLEIHMVSQMDLSLYYGARDGDYGLIFFISESVGKDQELQLATFLACKAALFGQAGISRLVAPVYAGNTPERIVPLLLGAGFSFISPKKKIKDPDLYICAR